MSFAIGICQKIRPDNVEILRKAITIDIPNPFLGGEPMAIEINAAFDEVLNFFYPVPSYNLKEAIEYIKWCVKDAKLSVLIAKKNVELHDCEYNKNQLNKAEKLLQKETNFLEQLFNRL